MAHKHISRLGVFVIILILSACSSATQSPPQPLNTLPPTWTQTVALDLTTTPPAATRTFAFTTTNEADTRATYDTYNLTNAPPTSTLAPTASLTPSLSPTAVPALRAHTWSPEPILIQLSSSGGDGGFPSDFPPQLLLFSTGQLILSNWQGNFDFLPLTTNLSRKEICRLLNTVDQNGFFDYDSNTYKVPFDGLPHLNIRVNAWRSNISSNQALSIFLDEDDWLRQLLIRDGSLPTPVILPSIENTYRLLGNYLPGSLKYFQPQEMIVWLGYPDGYDLQKEWPLASITLAELAQERDYNGDFSILSGDLMQEWLDKVPNGQYVEGNLEFSVYARPLWPYEKTTDRDFSSNIPDDTYPTLTEPLECKVIDGVLPIP